jgi:diguanylate cyclase (GGDEF)-like protein/PAS domain S-box-containing protein
MYGMALFLLYIYKNNLSFENLFFVLLLHTVILIYRLYFINKFSKIKKNLTDYKDIKKWVYIFQSSSFLSGIGWGIFPFFLQNTPLDETFILIATIVGIATIGISTLGSVFSVYLAFIIPMLSLTFIWIITQIHVDEIYAKIILPFLLMVVYLIVSSRKYEKMYNKSFQEEYRANLLNERMELALDGSITAIVDWDLRTNKFFITKSWKKFFGFEDEELSDDLALWRKRVHPEDKRKLFHSLIEHYEKKKEIFESTHRLRQKDGNYIWVFARTKILYDKFSKPYRIIGTHTEITKLKQLEDMLQKQKEMMAHLAHHDSLTNLPNRALFQDRLNHAISNAQRRNEQFALFFIDLDYFKEINDRYGHNAGDMVLKEVAVRLSSLIRDEDTLARLGGDEFTIIMQNIKHPQDVSMLAEKILDVLQKPILYKEKELFVLGSIGIGIYPKDGSSSEILLKHADHAMYDAKKEGKNRYKFFK